jgi:succinate-acetate transporter protein
MKNCENLSSLLLPAFVGEIIAVVAAVVWNHNTNHSGGWQDLAVGIGDAFILGGAMLYSFFWAIAAVIQLASDKKNPASDERTRTQCAYGLAFHCIGIFALFIAAGCLLL